MKTDESNHDAAIAVRPPGRQSVMVIAAISDTGPGLPSDLLDSIEHDTDWVSVVAGGRLRFAGTPGDLAATSIDLESLAGEHPIELSLRLLLQGQPEPPMPEPGR